MALVVQLTSPTGKKYFGSKADSEGLRYEVTKMEDAEHFTSQQAANSAIAELRQIRELKTYSFEIVEA